MTIVACTCTKEIKEGGALRAFAASKIIVSKSGRGSRSKRCSGSRHCVSISRFNFYSIKVINDWNSLPQPIVDSPFVNDFKTLLDRHYCDFLVISVFMDVQAKAFILKNTNIVLS